MPIVSCLSIAKASFSFVPTPSVPEMRTGCLYGSSDRSNMPPNPPSPPIAPIRFVLSTCFSFVLRLHIRLQYQPRRFYSFQTTQSLLIPRLSIRDIQNQKSSRIASAALYSFQQARRFNRAGRFILSKRFLSREEEQYPDKFRSGIFL